MLQSDTYKVNYYCVVLKKENKILGWWLQNNTKKYINK